VDIRFKVKSKEETTGESGECNRMPDALKLIIPTLPLIFQETHTSAAYHLNESIKLFIYLML